MKFPKSRRYLILVCLAAFIFSFSGINSDVQSARLGKSTNTPDKLPLTENEKEEQCEPKEEKLPDHLLLIIPEAIVKVLHLYGLQEENVSFLSLQTRSPNLSRAPPAIS